MNEPHHLAGFPLRLLFWESAPRCNLFCAHCRRLDMAEGAREMDTASARAMIDSAAKLGKPIIVFSGGEPLLRADWPELAEYARVQRELPIALATNGTLVDAATADRIAAAGFHRVSVSLDAIDAKGHDTFRGAAGAFDRALSGVAELRRRGVPVQINATISASNINQLDGLYDLARRIDAMALHLFILVPVGCGLELARTEMISPAQCRQVLEWVVERQVEGELELKATCAPQYSRVAADWLKAHPGHPATEKVRAMLRGRGCLGGVGVIFVSHAGDVFPCGYLPLSCGNVQDTPLERIWAESDVLARLRNFDLLKGKCGVCKSRGLCGGCRARAYGMSGDYLAPDSVCWYK